ncbi:MAG: hypothetical protein WB755_22165 [Terriglobales bacterium]|jgi:hypothetical protein
MQRPVGVTILALFEFFIATLLTFLAIASALGLGVLGAILARTSRLGDPAAGIVVGTGMMVGVIILGFAALFAVLGFGLWNLRNWGRVATIVLCVLGAVGASVGFMWALLHFRIFGVMVSSVRIGIDLLVVWYLSQAHVRRAFADI